ncbi:MAG: L-lactate dehydrogenase [Lachnospiraceae bacterium]|nr:L-lactate dehydrogenase [Lachnospiraceae bacterium]
MKVAVIGNGNVGMATFRELQKQREIQELVLIGRSQEKLQAEIEDFLDAEALATAPTAKLGYGWYYAAEGADILIYAAGAGQKPGQSRLELVEQNAKIARDIFTEVAKVNKDAVIVVLSNPVDIITAVIQETMGLPREKVIGTGTLLDTARLKRFIASLLDVSVNSTDMFVLGEHGDSSCVVWSSIRILGMSLDDYLAMEVGDETSVQQRKVAEHVRSAAGKMIAVKGYTAYGVAAAAGRVVSAVINDTHEILPVSVRLRGEYGVEGIAISVPCMIGRDGVLAVKQMPLTDEEKETFQKSVDILKEIAGSVGIR